MSKVISCKDVDPSATCGFTARAETEEEHLRKCAEHGRAVHDMQQLPPEMLAKVRGAIRDE